MSRTFPLTQYRNIGIIAHIDAGKTTTTERILFYTGKTYRLGSVDDGTTVTDWMEQERERGITIVSAAVTAEWKNHLINLIDTPGHIDFTAEVQRSLRVLDGGVVVFDATQGVEPQSETVWRQADRYQVPRICVANKMDRIGASYDYTIETIRQRLGANPLAMQVPIGTEQNFIGAVDLLTEQAYYWDDPSGLEMRVAEIPADMVEAVSLKRAALIERIAELDEGDVIVKFLEGETLTVEELKASLRKAVIANKVAPVFCGSSLKNKGVQPVLDAIVDYLPSPLDIPAVDGFNPHNEKPETRPADDDAPFSALVFKIVTDPYMGRLAYIRVYSGKLKQGSTAFNPTKGKRERMTRLVRMYADRREDVDEVATGDIAAVLGLKDSFTGDTLCDASAPIVLESISFPEPVIMIAVEPKTIADSDKMSDALRKLSEEDPTFRVRTDESTGQTILAGMGELHLNVLVDRMLREFKVHANIGNPRVSYRETITTPVLNFSYKHVKQTGGHGQYGHVVFNIEPLDRGNGVIFENKIIGGAIPREYINPIERGVMEAADSGPLAGYQVTDIKVTLIDGSFHEVDSSEMAFKTAAIMGFRQAIEKGNPVLLEPIMKVEVHVPEQYLGDVLGQLNARRSEISGIEARQGNTQVVHTATPLSEMFGYATDLRSATQGRGIFSMEFDHYSPLPTSLTEKILYR